MGMSAIRRGQGLEPAERIALLAGTSAEKSRRRRDLRPTCAASLRLFWLLTAPPFPDPLPHERALRDSSDGMCFCGRPFAAHKAQFAGNTSRTILGVQTAWQPPRLCASDHLLQR